MYILFYCISWNSLVIVHLAVSSGQRGAMGMTRYDLTICAFYSPIHLLLDVKAFILNNFSFSDPNLNFAGNTIVT